MRLKQYVYRNSKRNQERENRVAITPAGVKTLVAHGHKVFIQSKAG